MQSSTRSHTNKGASNSHPANNFVLPCRKVARAPTAPSLRGLITLDRSRYNRSYRAICTEDGTFHFSGLEKADVTEAPGDLNVTVREARNNVEFEQVGWLRGRAYYAVSRTYLPGLHLLPNFTHLPGLNLYHSPIRSVPQVQMKLPARGDGNALGADQAGQQIQGVLH
jgi:hypothetical protein